MLPNFIIVGAPRSGTTSLYRYSAEHPDVFMSSKKETNFFSSNPHGFTRRSYERLFEQSNGATAVGEASPSYLYDERAVEAINHAIPDCRIVIILRNPVDRLISDYHYGRSWGHNLKADLTTFISTCLNRPEPSEAGFSPGMIVKKGMYYVQVRDYVEQFGLENVFVRLYEDLQEEPAQLMRDLYAFIGVSTDFVPAVSHVHNRNAVPVFPMLSHVVARMRRLENNFVSPLLPSTKRGVLTKTILGWNRRPVSNGTARPDPDPEDRERLLELYRQDVNQLEVLIGRNLQAWRS